MKVRKRPGQSLIEVTMATMIAAVTTTAVFSVVLSSFVSDNRADKRDAAAMAVRHAQEILKSFVSVDPLNPAYAPTSSLGTGRWPADTSGTWALRDGTHNISSLVANPNPLSPAGSPAATLTYTVTSYSCAWFGMGPGPDFPTACKRVTFNLAYTD